MMKFLKLNSRSGTASLELVLGLPFILALGAAVLVMGFAGIKKANTTIKARSVAWKQRSDPPKNGALYLGAAVDSGKVEGESTDTAKIYRWMGGNKEVKGQSKVLIGTWDYRQVEDFEKNPKVPHLATAGRMVTDSPEMVAAIGAAGAVMGIVGGLFGGGGALPNQSDIDKAKDEANEAEKRAEKEEEKANEKKEEKKREKQQEIENLKAERRRLVAERQIKSDERTILVEQRGEEEAKIAAAHARLVELNRQANVYRDKTPREDVPQSLQNKISAEELKFTQADNDRTAINNQIRPLDTEIESLTRQIEAIDRQITEREQLLRDIDTPLR